MRKIGINMFATHPLGDESFIDCIADLGFNCTFSGVFDPERQMNVANHLAKRGLYYETLHAPFGHINDIWLDCDGGEPMLNELIQCVDRCAMVGAPIAVVHLSAGNTPPSITDIGRKRFAQLVEHAMQKNVRIAFENQRKLANLAWAFEAFGPDSGVAFCWDCGHESCFTPGRQYMPLFGDRLICTHIHDNAGVFDQDDHMLPFDGSIDFTRFARHIRRSGYTGSFMLEVNSGKSGRYADLSPEAFLVRAAKAVKRLVTITDGDLFE